MVIRINEKINKGVKKIENEKEKNIIKNLSYASKISKTQKEMKVLLQELMKNIKIAFSEEKNDIQFEDYFFNGIQIPNKIEFKEVSANNFKLFWKIDNIKIENIDNNQIKFKVEIKETNSDEKFTQVYEGNKDNCLIDNLKKNTNYEVRICSVYNNLIGSWSKIHEIKASSSLIDMVDSIILKESQKGEEYLQKIYEWSGYKKMELLYRGTRDGDSSDIFHQKCDNQGPTICLFKNDKCIFGGYASISWTNSGNTKSAPNSFLFTLLNIYKTPPTKFDLSNENNGVFHAKTDGPTFGSSTIYISQNYKVKSTTNFPTHYSDTLGKGRSIFTGETDNNYNNLNLKEIEVFKLI